MKKMKSSEMSQKGRNKTGGTINWKKVVLDLKKYLNKNKLNITDKDCKRRYHQLNRTPASRGWTDAEIQTLIYWHGEIGNNWKIIAKKIKGKNDKQ